MGLRRLFAIAISSLVTCHAGAQPEFGVSYYALQTFSRIQCDKALTVFDGIRVPRLAILWGTFGTNNHCLRRFFQLSDTNVLEVHVTNQTCLRSRICKKRELGGKVTWHRYNTLLEERDAATVASLEKRIFRIAHTIAAMRRPGSRLILSAGLEDNYSAAAFTVVKEILEAAQFITPFEIARNPHQLKRTPINPPPDLVEGHRFSPVISPAWFDRCIVNNDGGDIHFGEQTNKGDRQFRDILPFLEKYDDKGCLIFLWWSGPQGLETGTTKLAPERRHYELDSVEISQINSLMRKSQNSG